MINYPILIDDEIPGVFMPFCHSNFNKDQPVSCDKSIFEMNYNDFSQNMKKSDAK